MKRYHIIIAAILSAALGLGNNVVLAQAPPTNGLVAYYPFNGNANDASGNGYHGTNNGATVTTDRLGNPTSAYSFDGVDDYIAVSNFPVLDRTFTYAAWLKVLGTTIHHQSFGAHGEGGAVGETWNFGYNTDQKLWDTYDRRNGPWQVNMDIGSAWTHVAVVYDNNIERLYVNGVLRDSRSITTPVPAGWSNTLRIGTLTPGDQQFQGMIDEVRIYNRALNAEEIQALYQDNSSKRVILLTRTTADATVDYFRNLLTSHGIAYTELTASQASTANLNNAVIVAGFSNTPTEFSNVAGKLTQAVSQGSWMIAEAFGRFIPSYAGIGSASPGGWSPVVQDKYAYVKNIDNSPLFQGIPNWDPPAQPDRPEQYIHSIVNPSAIATVIYNLPASGVDTLRFWNLFITYGWNGSSTNSEYCQNWGGCTTERTVAKDFAFLIHHGMGRIFTYMPAPIVANVHIYGPIADSFYLNVIRWASMLPAPSLLSPINGATGISANPNLRWNAVTGATSYKLQVSSDSTFSTLVVNQSGLTSTSYNGSRLVNNTTYYWRVKAVNASGESAWSSVWHFTTKPAPIYVNVTNPQLAGSEFWVYVKIGDKPDSVANLFGLSFVLNFTQTSYLDVVSPASGNVAPGQFMGSDVVFHQTVDEAAGKVSVGISRKSGQNGVNGRGTVLRVKFVASANTPHGTQINFSITDVTAIDVSGASLLLAPSARTLTINHENVTVWPGDTNNDGTVNQADVLPIGLYWGKTGPARPNASLNWVGQICQPWTPLPAAYANANGDSIVNQADVLPIGFNWGKTHTTASTLAATPEMEDLGEIEGPAIGPKVDPASPAPGQEIDVQIQVHAASDLFGLAFELVCDRPEMLRLESAAPERAFGTDVVFYAEVNTAAGKAAVGISRKAGQEGMSGDYTVVRVKAKISSQATNGTTLNLSLRNVVANDPSGAPITLNPQSSQITVGGITGVDANGGTSLPTVFRLHQNHPNPLRGFGSNAGTLIRYELPTATQVVMKVYNATGQEVRTLVNKFQPSGYYQIRWDGRDERGQPLPSGFYMYRLHAGSFVQSYKMLLVR